jgi:hypothetical protein
MLSINYSTLSSFLIEVRKYQQQKINKSTCVICCRVNYIVVSNSFLFKIIKYSYIILWVIVILYWNENNPSLCKFKNKSDGELWVKNPLNNSIGFGPQLSPLPLRNQIFQFCYFCIKKMTYFHRNANTDLIFNLS